MYRSILAQNRGLDNGYILLPLRGDLFMCLMYLLGNQDYSKKCSLFVDSLMNLASMMILTNLNNSS